MRVVVVFDKQIGVQVFPFVCPSIPRNATDTFGFQLLFHELKGSTTQYYAVQRVQL